MGSVVGVSLGACVVEKHVKIEGFDSPDSGFSMPIDEYKKMVCECKSAKKIASGPDYTRTEAEEKATTDRRSIYCVKDIKAGEKFTEENVRVIRPGYGLKPKYYEQLIGKTAKRDIDFGDRITEEDL